MPVRNGQPLLVEALRSVMEQTERDLEIIVSDNGSEDGSTRVLKEAAASDSRIRYFRHDVPLTAYDNFRFVLRQARGEYFMWAAHDDSRDADFVARMTAALARQPEAVLAFGDLNIVTPTAPQGRLMRFPFETAGMGRLARMAKVSRFQCYHIYGVWRTAALKRVPYAHCDWWVDLPIMLSAAILGTFIHVRGSSFSYLELPKSGFERAKQLNFAERFSLVAGVAKLIRATFSACADVGGAPIGAYAAALVIGKQGAGAPGYLFRRTMRLLRAGATHFEDWGRRVSWWLR
jgi:glycosyltransferase involved in cell wall biosynthesis